MGEELLREVGEMSFDIEAVKARLETKLEIANRKGIRLGQYGNQASSMGGHLHDDIRALLNREADLSRQLAECREKLEAAEREHAVELENVEDLAKAIGKLSMKVLGYEHYCQSPAELLVRVEDYIDAASERAARVERAGLKLVEDIMDSLPHVDCIADMWLRDGIKKFKRSLEEQNDKD